ncbi:diguanylate cyclase [Alkalihalobacillus oceani]|uniref:Diguanylate cyclase n=1 Tax=Halalkalibacter oceani TaxID=1653776 RepID=A0A9X2INY9_9BACI|nr:diguanylate cyclase [Halalkalibacter oceani]
MSYLWALGAAICTLLLFMTLHLYIKWKSPTHLCSLISVLLSTIIYVYGMVSMNSTMTVLSIPFLFGGVCSLYIQERDRIFWSIFVTPSLVGFAIIVMEYVTGFSTNFLAYLSLMLFSILISIHYKKVLNQYLFFTFAVTFLGISCILGLLVIVYPFQLFFLLHTAFLICTIVCMFFFYFDRIIAKMILAQYGSLLDPLTGLYNRRFFVNEVTSKNNGTSAVIFSDIDDFKKLNETQGHEKGDEILITVAKIFKEVIGQQGCVARYGGEEIVVFLPNGEAIVSQLAEQIRQRVSDETVATLSIGYSTYGTSEIKNNIIDYSDQAMYMAKTTGKNKVVGYGSDRIETLMEGSS